MNRGRIATNWDVEQYRLPWDSEEQWDLRRSFILAHKDSIPEAKLVCLAQVFANMEFLRCSYPAEVTEEVQRLSVGVSEEFRQKRKANQGVAFVKGSQDDDNGSQISKGDQAADSETASHKAKRSRWEEPAAQTNSRTDRLSAASFFGPGQDTSAASEEPPRNRSANNYQIQSYYTSSYKSTQKRAADPAVGGAGGPGEVLVERPGIVDGFGTMPVDARQPSAVSSDNADVDPNHLRGRTTALSGKSANDSEVADDLQQTSACSAESANDAQVADVQRQFVNLVQLLSKCQPKESTTRWWLNDCVSRASMKISFPTSAVPKPIRSNPTFSCQVFINDVTVAIAEGSSKRSACGAAYELAVKKLLHPDMKIERELEKDQIIVVAPDLCNSSSPGPENQELQSSGT